MKLTEREKKIKEYCENELIKLRKLFEETDNNLFKHEFMGKAEICREILKILDTVGEEGIWIRDCHIPAVFNTKDIELLEKAIKRSKELRE